MILEHCFNDLFNMSHSLNFDGLFKVRGFHFLDWIFRVFLLLWDVNCLWSFGKILICWGSCGDFARFSTVSLYFRLLCLNLYRWRLHRAICLGDRFDFDYLLFFHRVSLANFLIVFLQHFQNNWILGLRYLFHPIQSNLM